MIEIGTDADERVHVRWAPGGPWTVLDRDGQVTTEPHALTAAPWCEASDEDGEGGVTDDFVSGYEAAQRDAEDAITSLSPPRRPRRRVETVTAVGGAL